VLIHQAVTHSTGGRTKLARLKVRASGHHAEVTALAAGLPLGFVQGWLRLSMVFLVALVLFWKTHRLNLNYQNLSFKLDTIPSRGYQINNPKREIQKVCSVHSCDILYVQNICQEVFVLIAIENGFATKFTNNAMKCVINNRH
jgi:hypothetical protein